jgi:hypothetical protein
MMARNFDNSFILLHGPKASEAKRMKTANIRAARQCFTASHANNRA